MDKEVQELRNLARHNKRHLMNKSIDIELKKSDYPLFIKGVGAKAIKLELYLNYDTILENKNSGYLEQILHDKINRVHQDTKSTMIGSKRIFY